ncbi:helix-turn-helix domain-containing protein [Acidothermaceae bacterium B102]|nr:helix-turn-helix domain-containing protein [Acidothermaceae bacterium B102]
MAQQEAGLPDLAARLNHLFAVVPGPSGRAPWTNDEAAAEMAAQGAAISGAYLSQLRTGKRDNPSARHLAAIAQLFGVPLEYFFEKEAATKIDADLRLLAAVRDSGVQAIALRAQGLSPQSLSSVADMIEHIRRLEQVPDHPTES